VSKPFTQTATSAHLVQKKNNTNTTSSNCTYLELLVTAINMPEITATTEDLVHVFNAMSSRKISLKGFLLAVFDDKIGDDDVQRAVSKFHHYGGSKVIIRHLNKTLPKKYLEPFHEAVMEVATGVLDQELDKLSNVPELRLPSNMITKDIVKDFSLALIVDKMKTTAPMLHDLLYSSITRRWTSHNQLYQQSAASC
jgi:hypothetical protein